MSVNGKRDDFTREDLLTVARSMNIRKPAEIIEEVVAAVSKWSATAIECGVPASQIKAIAAAHRLDW
jgi:serine/threonine-protein kinase HipA